MGKRISTVRGAKVVQGELQLFRDFLEVNGVLKDFNRVVGGWKYFATQAAGRIRFIYPINYLAVYTHKIVKRLGADHPLSRIALSEDWENTLLAHSKRRTARVRGLIRKIKANLQLYIQRDPNFFTDITRMNLNSNYSHRFNNGVIGAIIEHPEIVNKDIKTLLTRYTLGRNMENIWSRK